MAICAFEKCTNWFDGTKPNRGKKKKYCCRQCSIYASRSRLDKRRKDARHKARGKLSILAKGATKARVHASLNCLKYCECINSAYRTDSDMGCVGCRKSDMLSGAWKKEPGMLYCEGYDFTDHIA